MSSNSRRKLHVTKIVLLGVCFTVAGLALGKWVTGLSLGSSSWLEAIPLSELGATLFVIGVVGVAYDYYTCEDEDQLSISID